MSRPERPSFFTLAPYGAPVPQGREPRSPRPGFKLRRREDPDRLRYTIEEVRERSAEWFSEFVGDLGPSEWPALRRAVEARRKAEDDSNAAARPTGKRSVWPSETLGRTPEEIEFSRQEIRALYYNVLRSLSEAGYGGEGNIEPAAVAQSLAARLAGPWSTPTKEATTAITAILRAAMPSPRAARPPRLRECSRRLVCAFLSAHGFKVGDGHVEKMVRDITPD